MFYMVANPKALLHYLGVALSDTSSRAAGVEQRQVEFAELCSEVCASLFPNLRCWWYHLL